MAGNKKSILLAAGASGGHVFPALAIAEELQQQGYECAFLLGDGKFTEQVSGAGFPHVVVPSAPWTNRGIIGKANALVQLLLAFISARKAIKDFNPGVVAGMGGYATVAAVLAAKTMRIRTLIHEQNAYPGRANRLLAKYADKIALGFEPAKDHLAQYADKIVVTGNPLRRQIAQGADTNLPEGTPHHVLILGGSGGAEFMARIVTQALQNLTESQLVKLKISQQVLASKVDETKLAYKQLGIPEYDVAPFFADMPERLKSAQLVISRAGASAIGEIALYGRPSILIPHNLADDHQLHNANVLGQANAAIVMEQRDVTPQNLAERITTLLTEETKRTELAQRAFKQAQPDAPKLSAVAITELL